MLDYMHQLATVARIDMLARIDTLETLELHQKV